MLTLLFFLLRWVKKRPPVLTDCVPIPQRSENDLYRNMTVIPYLKILHGEEVETEDEEDIFYRVIPSTNCKSLYGNKIKYYVSDVTAIGYVIICRISE